MLPRQQLLVNLGRNMVAGDNVVVQPCLYELESEPDPESAPEEV